MSHVNSQSDNTGSLARFTNGQSSYNSESIEILHDSHQLLYGMAVPVQGNIAMNMPNAPPCPQSPNGTHHVIQPPWVHDMFMQFNMINQRMQEIHNRLDSLNNLEQFVNSVKHELHDMNSNMQDILNKTHNMDKRIHAIESTQAKTQNDITDIQARSMRDNLIFTNIEENINETNEETESKLRVFMTEKMKINEEKVTQISFERVHRLAGARRRGPRNIVAKFSRYKDREDVRKNASNLRGTNFSVFQQFPQSIDEQRRSLVPIMNDARRQGKKAYISYNRLYIDGALYEPTTGTARPMQPTPQ